MSNKFYLTTISCVLFALIRSQGYASQGCPMTDENMDGNIPVLSQEFSKLEASCQEIPDDFNNVHNQIDAAFKGFSARGLIEGYKAFKKLNYTEDTWQFLARQLDAYKWPSQQTWKQVVGGQLFFPKAQVYEYSEDYKKEYLMGRLDILCGFTFAGAFNHSLGLFYLGHNLSILNSFRRKLDDSPPDNVLVFCDTIMTQAYDDLKKSPNNSDVYYAMMLGKLRRTFTFDYNPSVYAGNDLKSQKISLDYERRYTRDVSIDDYLAIARQGDYSAYLEAADIAVDLKNKPRAQEILREAMGNGCAYAAVVLADLVKDEQERQSLIDGAMAVNVPRAFILKGFSLVGNLDIYKLEKKIKKAVAADEESYLQAANFFHQAGLLGDPRGFYYEGFCYQACIYSKISGKVNFLEPEIVQLQQKSLDTFWQAAVELGYSEAHDELEKEFPEIYKKHKGDLFAVDPCLVLWREFELILNPDPS